MPEKLKILIIGAGGGREHALGWKITQPARNAAHNAAGGSPPVRELFFARGNAGTAKLGTNLDIKETDAEKLLYFSKAEKMDLVLVVSDDALAAGVVDEFQKAGFRTWGPTKAAAKIEWSKTFSKDFMRRHNLPTAKFETFNNFEKAKEYVKDQSLPIVIKANGLALGKGVVICPDQESAYETLENFMIKKIFGESGSEVVIEEFMEGPEISIHVFSDGKNYKMFPVSQDHKKIGEGNTGPNTGGIGAITPLPFVDEKLFKKIEEDIVAPAIRGLVAEGTPFVGILYPGLMLTKDGPNLLEFNARFGDPEAEVYMRILESDLLDVIDASIDGKLNELEIKWVSATACNIVLCSLGYPGKYETGKIISGVTEAEKEKDIVVFYAGTKMDDKGNLVTNGGRVLGVSAMGETLPDVLKKAYNAISKITFEGMQYRRDIGKYAK